MILLVIIPMTTFSATVDELTSNMNNLSAQIDSLNKEIDAYNKQIASTQGEAKTLKSALSSLETRKSLLLKQITKIKLQIVEAEGNIKKTEGQISVTQSKIEQNSQALGEVLRKINSDEIDNPVFLQIFTNTKSLGDVFDEIKRNNDISNAINSYVRNLNDNKVNLNLAKTDYESSRQKLVSLNDTLSDQKKLIDQTANEKNQLLVETKNKESNYQKLLADRSAKKDALEAELSSVESQLSVITDTSKLPNTGKGVLSFPVSKVIITQYFGNTPFSTKNPQVYNGMGHNGVDFGVSIGTPIYAARAGVVLGTGNTDLACSGASYGKWVLIKHANGLSTLYAHLSVINVSAGQTVDTGEKIALSGNTGYSTGPHLHFTVYASDSVHIAGATEYKSKVCGTYLIMPLAPRTGYLNPLSYLP